MKTKNLISTLLISLIVFIVVGSLAFTPSKSVSIKSETKSVQPAPFGINGLVTINSSGVYNYFGTTGDTIKKDGYKDLDFYVPTYATDIVACTKMNTKSGKSKVKTVVMGSFDNTNFWRIDSSTTNANNGIHKVTVLNFNYNYIKIRCSAFDSTGTTRLTSQILIGKK